ncbi:TPA: BapA prefix-like domain-containing protein [Salmonella enterica subsp. enterica serovar Typhi]|uniref:BapA prefix-like domain-containing protein n=2 Tax=Salmonella typhi TaxID=90370 RepID=A0A719L4C3_SALTI|nr:BapA prefix-like domain-containing protein [Salmonella enterica]EEB4670634.1 BapA prefix-like domain-containing protein [Salmonella enterica subsp. enterica serovar Typhi]HAD4011509.1 BapA prefix-like domain-containing protein [Salmonella enterica subsp. enterica serovar Typhi str. CT18]HAD7233467.1 BapA prefix-like domain-containing protein [Salmonella enterica subsp. enterica serovar Typhi str. 404ty]EDY3419094.1 BapA prefix-like domain-containing protein [Salmonella enterica]
MRLLAVVSKLTGVSTTLESSAVTLNAPSIVKLSVARDEISQLTRINQDLVVRLHSGETITIKNFYVTNDLGASQLVLAENDGTLWWVENPQAGLHFEQIADINELLVTSGASHEAGGAVWPWVLAGAVAAGGIAAIASSGGGDSHHHSDGDNPPPDNTNPDGNPPDNSNPGGSNPNGNTPGSSNPVDTTPPLAPGELLISADGKTVSGEAEAGSLITIKDPSGNVVGEGKADSDGKFSIDLTAPQISGEQLTVTATDDAGNTGPSATIDAPNIPLPDTPVITAAIDDAAPLTGTLSNNQFTNDNTPTLEGTGSAGTVIHIYANGQEIGSTTVDTSGNWHFAITSALADGENHFTAIATNVKGESSESARFTLTIDTLSPDAPRVELMADNTGLLTGPLQNNDRTDEAKPLFSGQGEAGNTITIKEGSTVIGSATVDENGRWTFTPTTPLSDGEHTFTVEQSDKAGNASRVTTTPTIIVDTTPPDAAIIDNVAKDGTTVSGTAEAGSTVSIYDPAGNYLGSTITGENNHFSITLNPAQTHGERLEARIQDAVGNIGPATEFTASDSQYPAQPTILTVTDDAGAVTGLLKNGDATDDNRPTLSGTAEPGSTISINDNGFPVPSFPPIVADADGKWSFTPSLALADGDHVFTATATNDRGTSGQSVAFTIDIDTQPPVLEGLAVSDVGDRLTGTTEAGSTVVIKDSLGNTLGSGTAGDDGTFSIGISPAKINGETLSISVTDKAANSGPVETLNAPDKTAPAAPNGLIVATDGLSVSGQAEAGATVTIRDSSNTVLGSAVANGNGQFIVPLNAAQTNGQALIATATDIANNESAAATVDAPDSTAPEMPKNVVISEDGASISDTAEPGSSITITTPDGTPLGSGKADGEGHFTLPLAPAQTNGEQVTVTATDSANNVSPPTTAQAPDITAPDKPIITQVLDDVESFTGPLVNGQTTNDNRPTLSGTAEAGARVEIFDNGVSLGLATLQPNGGWTFTPSQNLGEGAHRLTVIATDAKGNASPAGNESPESISFTLRIDTQAPDAPQIVSAAITGGEGEVLLANGSITNQRMPTLSGTGEPGAIITLYNNGVELATVQVNPQGSWTYPLTRNLSEGLNILTATATDAAGNSSPTSGVFSVTLDTQPPAQPDAPLISDNVAPVIGNIGNNGATNDTTPTFSGTGEIGSTIILYNNGSEIGRTTVGDNGSWNFTPAALTPETYTITVTETDIAGNISPPSASVTFTLDTTAPANPVITFAEDNVGEVQDTIVSGATTDDNTPVIHGTGDIGSVITLYNGSSVVGVVTVDETGTWTLPVTSALPDGVYTLTAIAADAAGNSSGVSNSFTFTVDTVPLQPPVVNEILDDVAPVTGPLTDGAFTNDRTLTINGSGENGSTVTIYDNGVAIGTALVTDGVWTFNTSELSEASHALTFSATDDAGNTTAQTQPITITVDITAPPAPTIQTVADDGTRVAGLADPYATVEIHHADGTLVGSAVANGTGEFVVTLSPAQTDGGTLTAIAIDRAGNNGPATNFPASDSGLPAVPAITAIEDDVGSIQGNIAAGGATDDTMPTLRGTTDIGSTVEVFIDGDSAGFATVDASGNWIFEIATPLSESTHYFTVQATNANGPGGLSAPVGITVDLSAPAQPVITSATDDVPGMTGTLDNGALTNDSRPTLNGTGEAGATITLYENGTVIGTTTAQPDGAWSVSTSTLASGTHVITAVATDAAGNSSPNSTAFTLTVDTTAPQTPILTSVVDDVAGGVTGNLANGQITNDNRPTLNGTAEAGSVVSIYDGDTLLGVTSANASGAWSFTPTTGLNDGTRTLTVTATDPAGNVSPATSGFTIVVDTLAPTVPLITSIVDDVPNNTGAIGNGQSTNDTQPTLNGTAEANSAVSIFDNGALVATVNANASGNWSWTPTASLGQGSHAYSVSAADAAGNVSAASPSTTIIVDTIAPGAPGNLVINATGNRVTGTAEAGSTVTITSETGVVLGTATADGTGSFTATLTPAQTNGQPLLAFAQDKAGNTGIAAGFTAPDTRVPEAPIITNVVDDVGIYTGAIANGPVTNDAQPTLNGTAQAGATVSIYNNGALLGTTTANASGNWSFTPTGNLTEGSHAFTATATNANGTGSVSTAATVIVDTLAPGTPSGTLSADGGSLSGQAEANSTVTVTLAGGVTLTTTAGSNGAWSLTLPTKQIEGQLINVTATDAAGNASGTLGITAPILPLAARDNITSLDLTSTAVTSTQNYSDYGLLLVGALGNVASVLGNDTAQVEFTIAEGGTGDVTIDAAATGIVLSLLSTQEIVVQRYDTSLGTWTTIVNTAVGDFANLLTLTGSGVTLNLNGLGEGQYRVLTYNTSLLATGSYTSLDVDVHQTSAGIISGPTISTGNVMADDTAPTGTTVTAITNANGVSTPVGAGGVDILGQYGTLHINQDGSYTYTLTKPTAGYGHKESFTYTITQNGVGSSAAQLVINLGPAPVPGSVIATDNNASLVFDTHVSYVNNGPSTQSGVTVLSVGLGNVLNANLLDDMTNPIIFNVEEGATRTMTLQGTVGGVSLVSTFDLYVYRFNDAIQQYEQFRVQKGWINTLLLAGQSQPLTLTLPGGEYLFVLNTASGISVLTGYTLAISQDHTYAVDSITANTTGNVLTNDVAPTDALLTEVNGVAIAATGTTEVNGLYGSLIIDARGNYTYTLKNGVGADSIKTPDSFIYTLKAPNGDTDTASLNITPTARALDAINDVSDTLSVATLQDTAAWLDSSVGSASWGLLGKSGSGSGTFDVATGTVLKGASLVFDVSTLITLGNLNISWAIQENGTVIRNGTVPVANITLGSATVTVNLSGLELDAGTYTLNFTGTNTLAGAATITPRVIGTTVDLDNFETSGTHTVLGNIFDGSDAAGAMDQLNTVNTRLSISGYNGSAATLDAAANTTSATIQGHYGTLQINLDGAYTYTLNNGVAMSSITSKEVFTYQLDDKIGHTDSATLTIDMAPQIVSTNQNDVLIGSAYGDTLIYHLLNGADATGGNGADRWQNFSTAQGDKIDIHELLTGWDHQAATLGNFVQVHTSGANTVISVDRDGAGSAFKSTDLVTLENVQLTLNDLLQNNHLITGG